MPSTDCYLTAEKVEDKLNIKIKNMIKAGDTLLTYFLL